MYTVNMVIFAWGTFRENVGRTFNLTLGLFSQTRPISFIKTYGFYFHDGVIFAKKTEALKM